MKNEIMKVDYNSLIYEIRGNKVMLDSDLANLYGVETKRLKEKVRRNISRFPEDFMFIITFEEFKILRSQFASSSWGGSRHDHMVFTEHGVAMLSTVLNSERAIAVNIQIIRVFTRMRKMIESYKEILRKLEQLEKKDLELDEKVTLIFEYLKDWNKQRQTKLILVNENELDLKLISSN